MTWPGIAGRIYRIATSPELGSGWTRTGPLLLAVTNAELSATINIAGERMFVRVEIVP